MQWMVNCSLIHLPHIQHNTFEGGCELRFAHEKGVVEPRITAVGRGLELGSGLEIELFFAHFIGTIVDNAAVAHVDIHTVVSLDGVDGLQLSAGAVGVGQLVVGSAIENGAVDGGSDKGASGDGDHDATTMLRVTNGIGLTQCHSQLHDELQSGIVLGRIGLRTKTDTTGKKGDEKEYFSHIRGCFAAKININSEKVK